MQRSALCRSRRELSNAYLLAKIRFDTAENEPCKVCREPYGGTAKVDATWKAAAAPANAGNAIQEFDFAWVRESLTKKWGVDLASDSPQSMTVLHRCLFDPNGASGGSGVLGLGYLDF